MLSDVITLTSTMNKFICNCDVHNLNDNSALTMFGKIYQQSLFFTFEQPRKLQWFQRENVEALTQRAVHEEKF